MKLYISVTNQNSPLMYSAQIPITQTAADIARVAVSKSLALRKAQTNFSTFDADASGTIDVSEFKHLVYSMGYHLSPTELTLGVF